MSTRVVHGSLTFASRIPIVIALLLTILLFSGEAWSQPGFARQYNISCAACHSAFPKLNAFGEQFAGNNFRLPNWKEATTVDVGDDMLRLPKFPPFAIRAQAYVQGRDGEEVDVETGPTGNDSSFDFQSPYLIKLLSSAPLSDHMTYYFYGIFAEKGDNGETVIEDAWFRHDDLFGSEIAMQLGQFQVSDLMFPREVRLSFQDYYAYRAAGITYERGVVFDRDVGPVGLGLGLVNGSGIEQNFTINSPGYKRPDKMFDNDSQKSVFGRIGIPVGPVEIGLFALTGEQKSATGYAGTDTGTRKTDKRIFGVDLSGDIGARYNWYVQVLWNQWDDFFDQDPNFPDRDPDADYDWVGGFAGIDYIHSDRWAFSALYNYAEADDFDDTGTIYEGIEINSLALTASYYFMRNVKAVLEANVDFLSEDQTGPPYVGHQDKEHYLLFGFDTAF
ncbi:MAG: hypothetical protein JNJ67_01745 [Chromatiales bacterium]|jgi:hypothetical protein|nr:hypothetical protein [Chromatiales bacterium]